MVAASTSTFYRLATIPVSAPLHVRGTGGIDAEQRVKLLKLLWDAIGTEFGGRGELYEINWSGSTEENRIGTLGIAQATGLRGRSLGAARSCRARRARLSDARVD
jgi:aromatic ring hydroxylase